MAQSLDAYFNLQELVVKMLKIVWPDGGAKSIHLTYVLKKGCK